MRFCSASFLLPVLLAWAFREWLLIRPRVDWTPSSQVDFDNCPAGKDPLLIFGATSMLGKYVVSSFEEQTDVCLISFARSNCPKCQVNVRGDMRDIRLIERVLKFYRPKTVVTSVKPPLLYIHYKTYIELNLLSMVQLIEATKAAGVENFLYVSSIAAAGHYFDHQMASELDSKPYYTDFEAPYDVSKRFAEDYLLKSHESGKFNAIAIRVGGIIGGDGDPYDYMRWPVLGGFEPEPPRVDSNYAGNIADALVVVFNKMVYEQKHNVPEKKRVTGQFYYYTGESMSETQKIRIVANEAKKPLVILPLWTLSAVVKVWYWATFDPLTYSFVDLLRMGLIPQTFNQTKFHSAFPEFKEKLNMEQALRLIYGGKDVKV